MVLQPGSSERVTYDSTLLALRGGGKGSNLQEKAYVHLYGAKCCEDFGMYQTMYPYYYMNEYRNFTKQSRTDLGKNWS